MLSNHHLSFMPYQNQNKSRTNQSKSFSVEENESRDRLLCLRSIRFTLVLLSMKVTRSMREDLAWTSLSYI